jgi:hypothetical protein
MGRWPIRAVGGRPADRLAHDLLLYNLLRDARLSYFHRLLKQPESWMPDRVAHLGGDHRGLQLAADLLDEAAAAFLDYVVAAEDDVLAGPGGDHNHQYLVVFDVGGAAAAVTGLRVAAPAAAAFPQVEVLASSPGPGLGGGAVDADVAGHVLWPQLLGRNGLGPEPLSDADWRAVEAVLATLAEDLTVGVAREVNRLERPGGPDPADRGAGALVQPTTTGRRAQPNGCRAGVKKGGAR